MKMWPIALSSLWLLVGTSALQAQVTVDVGKITCQQFLTDEFTDTRSLALWMSGYFHGMHNDVILDANDVKKHADAVMNYCLEHSSANLMDATKFILGENK